MMILPDFVLESRRYLQCRESGIDSLKHCLDKNYFRNYPNQVEYSYNSRGFRDTEWPADTELKHAVWCLGDSYTVGLGSPYNHTWPYLLSQKLSRRCINVSLDGASNQWIARKIKCLLESVNPSLICVQWSHLHRCEHPDVRRTDEDRRQHVAKEISMDNQYQIFSDILQSIEDSKGVTKIIHSVIPASNFVTNDAALRKWNLVKGHDWDKYPPAALSSLSESIILELKAMNLQDYFESNLLFQKYSQTYDILNSIIDIEQIDYARDHLHYGALTADLYVNEIVKAIKH